MPVVSNRSFVLKVNEPPDPFASNEISPDPAVTVVDAGVEMLDPTSEMLPLPLDEFNPDAPSVSVVPAVKLMEPPPVVVS